MRVGHIGCMHTHRLYVWKDILVLVGDSPGRVRDSTRGRGTGRVESKGRAEGKVRGSYVESRLKVGTLSF